MLLGRTGSVDDERDLEDGREIEEMERRTANEKQKRLNEEMRIATVGQRPVWAS